MGHTGDQIERSLVGNINAKTVKIGIVGLGYVGLPFAVEAGNCGFAVIGFDRSREKVDKINAGENYIGDVDTNALRALVGSGLLKATTDMALLGEMDVSLLGTGGRMSSSDDILRR